MKIVIILGALAAAAAVLATPLAATPKDYNGPACSNIVNGDFSYNKNDLSTDPTTPLAHPYVTSTMDLAVPSCKNVIYTVSIYSGTDTTTLIQTLVVDGADIIAPTATVSFPNYEFSSYSAAPDYVCIVGTTAVGSSVSDRAPDTGCLPVAADSSGGSQSFG